MSAYFAELPHTGLIAARGADTVAFLQAQLTSDVAAMRVPSTQYSGYCTPKGRLIATFLLWRETDAVYLQVPESIREAVQGRLSKYVLRSKVKLENAGAEQRLVAVWGSDAARAVAAAAGAVPEKAHDVIEAQGMSVTRLPVDRFLVRAARAPHFSAEPRSEEEWARLDVEAGVPVVAAPVQEEFVPQMVNLDLIGGVSYSKGCYPGQEIVARTHYLGKLKQRMFRVRVPVAEGVAAGDSLYSEHFGAEQASGTIVSAVRVDGGFDALAVVRIETAAPGALRWRALDGPPVELEPLPYRVSAET